MGAIARRDALAYGPATSQYGATALFVVARRGHKDMVKLLLDRGADLEAKMWVSAVAVCCCAAGRARRHGRTDGGAAMAVTRPGVVALWRAGVRGSAGGGGKWEGERRGEEVRWHAGTLRRSMVVRRSFRLHLKATRTWWSCCWTGVPTWRPRTM